MMEKENQGGNWLVANPGSPTKCPLKCCVCVIN